MSKSPMEMMQSARANLLLRQPFFGALALRLKLVESPERRTAATDGVHLYFNPEWIKTLTDKTRMGLVAHEVWHCVLDHPGRRGNRTRGRWNVAGDHVINLALTEARIEIPGSGLCDHQFKDKTTDQVYALLPENDPKYDEQDPGGCGEVIDLPADAELVPEKWKAAAHVAARTAKNQGKLPACVEKELNTWRNPKIPWQERLRRFAQEVAKNDYTWQKLNRRYIHQGIYLPSLDGQQMGEIIIACDTSGSVNERLFEQFLGEINAIKEDVNPERIRVMYCDSKVHRVDVFERDDTLKANIVGRGGTSFVPVFDWIEEQRLSPACLIYFTDLAGRFPNWEPSYPVLWASEDRRDIPFGELVDLA